MNVLKNINYLLDIGDIFKIIQLNILLGLNDLRNKSYIFNESIHYLIKIYSENEDNENTNNFLKLIMIQLYSDLSKSQKNLYFCNYKKN